ncbi:MAG: hypothetical protein ISQ65_06815 [Pseudomonadales bacterium]|nr:hypothetical protein [Pseudomonadales bacterium]
MTLSDLQARLTSAGVSRRRRLFAAFLTVALSACAPDPGVIQSKALETAGQWFDQAHASQAAEAAPPPTCHAFGLIKFTDASCDDMIEHAAALDPKTRRIESVRLLECFGQGGKEVCGDFAEIWFNTQNADGVSVREGMVLKRDNDAFRMYWYRSDTLFTLIANRAAREEAGTTSAQMAEKQEKLDAVYTQIVERDPGVYTYPPCIDAQVTSAAMLGGLLSQEMVTATELDRRAEQCNKALCLALVGKRIAALCQ